MLKKTVTNFSFSEDKLILNFVNEETTEKHIIELSPVGNRNAYNVSIVGDWTYFDLDYESKGFYRFKDNGKAQLMFEFPGYPEIGKYTYKEKILSVELKEKASFVRKVQIDKDQLIMLATDNKKEVRYIKW